MIKKLIFFFYILFFFFNSVALTSQNNFEEKKPLIEVLKILEEQFNILFSYADTTIKGEISTIPSNDLTLNEALNELRISTNLNFEVLNSKFVIIKKSAITNSKVYHLNEILITNYLTQGISKLNDGSLELKPNNFGILPGLIEPDILQIIQANPGILSVNEKVSNINVRGGTHDQNLLLWDGIKMYQSGHFFGLISAFNPYITEKVRVSKNGTSAKYGDGISSIIDMKLSDELEKEFKTGISFNLINVGANTIVPLSKNTELQLSFRRSLNDLVETPTYTQYFKRVFQDSDFSQPNRTSISKNENFYFYDISAKLLYNLSKNDKLRIHFLTINNKLNYEEQSTVNKVDEVLNSKLVQQNLASGITYSRNWNSSFTSTAQIYLSNYKLDATNFDILNSQRLIQENEVFDGSVKLDFNYLQKDNLSLNFGYHFSEVGISNLEDVNNPTFRSYIKEVLRSHAFYTEILLQSKKKKTNLKLGIRTNYLDKFDKILIEPRINFSQKILKNLRFEVLGELKSQTTSQIIDLQNDFLGIEKRRWVLSNNQNIPIIKSKQISAGFHYNKNGLLLTCETFLKEVNGITTRSQGFQNQFQFINAIGSYSIKGVDLLLNNKFNNSLSSWIGYSFGKNNYTFPSLNNGQIFPNNADIRHALTFASTYTVNKIKFAIGFNWHSGKPTTKPLYNNNISGSERILYEQPNSHNLSDYIRADCSVTYNFQLSNTSNATIGTSVWNILNKKNIINEYYILDTDNNISKIENQSLGITPNLSMRIQF